LAPVTVIICVHCAVLSPSGGFTPDFTDTYEKADEGR